MYVQKKEIIKPMKWNKLFFVFYVNDDTTNPELFLFILFIFVCYSNTGWMVGRESVKRVTEVLAPLSTDLI